jgi:hypothetical protein
MAALFLTPSMVYAVFPITAITWSRAITVIVDAAKSFPEESQVV